MNENNGLSFKNSPFSRKIYKFFTDKICETIGIIGVLKACSIVSAKLDRPKLNLFVIAPTGQFKSVTSHELIKIFPKGYMKNVGSDFTIHSLAEEFKGKVPKTCISINDFTLLMASKSKRTRDRLTGGLAELLSDGYYLYGERQGKIQLIGNPSCIVNMTAESYSKHEKNFEISTFTERFLTVFYSLTLEEMENFVKNKHIKRQIIFEEKKFKGKKFVLKNIDEYRDWISQKALLYSILSMRGYLRTADWIEGVLKSHAFLNKRDYICQDDVILIEKLETMINNPYGSIEIKIVKLYREGFKQNEIVKQLNLDRSYINRIIKRAKQRGVL